MDKLNKIIPPNQVVAELNSIIGDLDLLINRVHSLFRLVIREQRQYESHIAIMQDDFENVLSELKKYKNGEIQNN